MAEKSPAVHPTRHRRVLIPARFQTDVEFQNCVEDNRTAVALLRHSVLTLLLLPHTSLRCNADSNGLGRCSSLQVEALG